MKRKVTRSCERDTKEEADACLRQLLAKVLRQQHQVIVVHPTDKKKKRE